MTNSDYHKLTKNDVKILQECIDLAERFYWTGFSVKSNKPFQQRDTDYGETLSSTEFSCKELRNKINRLVKEGYFGFDLVKGEIIQD